MLPEKRGDGFRRSGYSSHFYADYCPPKDYFVADENPEAFEAYEATFPQKEKLLPILELPLWLWLWAGVIVAIKIVNQLSALMMYGRCSFPHTTANKATGFLLFIAVPMTFLSIIPFTIVAAIATFAAIHEGHYIRTYHLSFPPLLHGATGRES